MRSKTWNFSTFLFNKKISQKSKLYKKQYLVIKIYFKEAHHHFVTVDLRETSNQREIYHSSLLLSLPLDICFIYKIAKNSSKIYSKGRFISFNLFNIWKFTSWKKEISFKMLIPHNSHISFRFNDASQAEAENFQEHNEYKIKEKCETIRWAFIKT